MSDERPPLLILGASARSAAHSAIRAGFRPICADVFADEDLQSAAEVLPLRVAEYPEDLVRCARLAPPCPWIYTGAMENYPHVVESISADRPLWGNDASTIRKVRNPVFVQAALEAAGLPVPDVRSSNDPPPHDGTWMIKPDRSGGGRGIHVWNEHARHCGTLHEPHWFQKRIDGESLAALFVGSGEKSVLIGATRQWVGSKHLHGLPHSYCGTIGPLELSSDARAELSRLGDTLAAAADLRGIFGVDGIRNEQGFWPVDINPRYTASVEVLEHAFHVPLLAWHIRAFDPVVSGLAWKKVDHTLPERPFRYGAKAILFAKRHVIAPPLVELFPDMSGSLFLPPALADRPVPGTEISAGQPICSVFGWGNTDEVAERQLHERVRLVERALYPP